MFFTSFWLSFAMALYLIGKNSKDLNKMDIEKHDFKSTLLFFIIGVQGGCISSLTGTGIDILTFSFLTLYFGICVKIATPTSVVLMGINSLVGFLVKGTFIEGGIAPEAWNYLLVCIPIVIVGAPLGAIFITDKSRHFIEKLLFIGGIDETWHGKIDPILRIANLSTAT